MSNSFRVLSAADDFTWDAVFVSSEKIMSAYRLLSTKFRTCCQAGLTPNRQDYWRYELLALCPYSRSRTSYKDPEIPLSCSRIQLLSLMIKTLRHELLSEPS